LADDSDLEEAVDQRMQRIQASGDKNIVNPKHFLHRVISANL
jgi:hypothetical protein